MAVYETTINNQVESDTRDETILKYLPLVEHLVGRIVINCPSYLDHEDLTEAGIIGLIQAVDSYQPTRGCTLKSYAYTKIKGAILDEMRKTSFLPRKAYAKVKKVQKKFSEFTSTYGRPPSLAELEESLSLTSAQLDEILTILRSMAFVSLEAESIDSDGEGYSILDHLKCPKTVSPDEVAEKNELLLLLVQALQKLPERERQVIAFYYEEELLLSEIAEVMNISVPRVSQLHSRALYRLNQMLYHADKSKTQKNVGGNSDAIE